MQTNILTKTTGKAHYHGTAEEIIHEKPQLDYFIAGLGTTELCRNF